MSTAHWSGVKLTQLLQKYGINHDTADSLGIRHVIFTSHDGLQASIPIRKALDKYGDVLLAYEMNGVDIPKVHGFPIRAVIPGHVGVRFALRIAVDWVYCNAMHSYPIQKC